MSAIDTPRSNPTHHAYLIENRTGLPEALDAQVDADDLTCGYSLFNLDIKIHGGTRPLLSPRQNGLAFFAFGIVPGG